MATGGVDGLNHGTAGMTVMPHMHMELGVIRQKVVHVKSRSQSVAVNPPDLRSLFPKRLHQWQWLQPVAVPPVAVSTIWFHFWYPQLRMPTPGATSTMFHMWHLGSHRHDSRPQRHTSQSNFPVRLPERQTEGLQAPHPKRHLPCASTTAATSKASKRLHQF